MEYIESRSDLLASTTSDFIKTPSPSGSEGDVAKLLSEYLAKAGLEVQIDIAGNVLGTLRGKAKGAGKRLAFNVHLDHVPPGQRESWAHDPYSGLIDEGKVYGRGASDTKGAWAPMVLAIDAIRNSGGVDGDVLFTAVVMEELTYCIGMKVLLDTTLKSAPPDYIVSGEATALNIAVGHRGRTELELLTRGRSCHASAPWRGENAIYKLAPLISSIEKLSRHIFAQESHPLLGKTTLALTDVVCSPGAHNVVPDLCKAYLDYRFLPGEDLNSIMDRVRHRLNFDGIDAQVKACESDEATYAGMAFHGQKFMPAYAISPDHPLVSASMEAATSVMGGPPKLQRWDFATDGGYSMGILGIPTIGFSPCEEQLAHTPNEYVQIDYLVKAAKVYAEMILRLCGSQ
ncbi:MAG: YgeY family selenium metabolism-linked hydrolase [Candidatus Methanomethylicaceae archaeon]|jgi:putative selenium metabolism hydrolase